MTNNENIEDAALRKFLGEVGDWVDLIAPCTSGEYLAQVFPEVVNCFDAGLPVKETVEKVIIPLISN